MLLKSKKSQSCTEAQINTNEQNLRKKKTFGLSIKKKMRKGPNLLWVTRVDPLMTHFLLCRFRIIIVSRVDPNPLRSNPNPKKPVLDLYRVRGLGRTLTPIFIDLANNNSIK